MTVKHILSVTRDRCRIFDYNTAKPKNEFEYDPDYGLIADTRRPETMTNEVLQREVKLISAGEDFDLEIEVR